MPKYRRIARVVNAQQFRTSKPLPDGVVRVAVDGRGHVRGPASTETLAHADTREAFAVWTRGGWALVFDGSWIVTHPYHQSVWSAEAFDREFEVILEAVP